MKKFYYLIVTFIYAIILPTLSIALNSADLIAATIHATVKQSSHCLNFKMPTRVCFWWDFWDGMDVTPYLDHYLPDLVVVVYANQKENPWDEVRALLDSASNKIQNQLIKHPDAGGGSQTFLSSTEQQVLFKEAEVIGNPGLMVTSAMPFLLPTTASSYLPYYSSLIDSKMWRGLMPGFSQAEEIASLGLNITHHIGTGFTDWGGLYPHQGSVVAMDELQGAIVIAMRATHLLTNTSHGHIYHGLSTDCGKECSAYPIIENSNDTLFQPIYPKAIDQCTVLGSDQSYDARTLEHNQKGAYAWIVWRHYKGCLPGNGKYIGRS